ncbi:hypothetical protein [Mycolicibacter kumamotonensis]|uniref:Uncharacterized protein n=1 Tax=Mycolicibacter kumamotonensis TaxID=354243 RepID=A0A1B8SL26_9MYCO|nr:hypothetical protein [Mycolicibacter kumamotonensis]OBY33452.1 hypothetical protein ACT18_00430 [Mycolicibacter kumamotonensis]
MSIHPIFGEALKGFQPVRNTGGKIIWTGNHPAYSTLPLDDNGARYIISRFGGQWVILYLPQGTPQPDDGHERVPFLSGRQSLVTAKQAVVTHWNSKEH